MRRRSSRCRLRPLAPEPRRRGRVGKGVSAATDKVGEVGEAGKAGMAGMAGTALRPGATAGRIGPLTGLFSAVGRATPPRLQQAGRHLAQSLRLMVGVPDYDAYVAHLRRAHPGREPMSYEAFFRERQQARYGGGTGRCC